jgi:hypothetical protein
MIMKTKHFVVSFILLFTLMACAFPGMGQPAALPTFDPNSIPTMVALTANAAMAQTAAAPPPATLDAAFSLSQTTLEPLPDGSAKYTDNEVGFEVIFPTGWLTVRPNSEEFDVALNKEATKIEALQSQMQADKSNYEVGRDRVYSYPLLPDIEKNFMFGASISKWDPNDSSAIDENSMGDFYRGLETSGTIPGFRTDTARVNENGNHVKMIEVGGPFTISDGQGGFIPFYVTCVFFRPTHGGVVMMLFTYLKDYKLSISNDVMSIIDSITLLGQ